jgi:hypothetical protein
MVPKSSMTERKYRCDEMKKESNGFPKDAEEITEIVLYLPVCKKQFFVTFSDGHEHDKLFGFWIAKVQCQAAKNSCRVYPP